jgi:hypothetical protein
VRGKPWVRLAQSNMPWIMYCAWAHLLVALGPRWMHRLRMAGGRIGWECRDVLTLQRKPTISLAVYSLPLELLPGARKTAMFCWLRREFRRFKNNVRLAGLSATCKKRVLLSVLSRPEQQLSCTSTQLSCSLYEQVECQARWLLLHQFLLPSYGANPQVQP